MPKSKKPFKKAYLEITSQCNLDCSFCPKTSRPPQFITVEQFDYLLGQVQPLTDFVYLHLMGEAFAAPAAGPTAGAVRSTRAEGVADHQRHLAAPLAAASAKPCSVSGQHLSAQL